MNVPKEGVKLDLKLPQKVLAQENKRRNNTNLRNTRALRANLDLILKN